MTNTNRAFDPRNNPLNGVGVEIPSRGLAEELINFIMTGDKKKSVGMIDTSNANNF